MVGANPLGIRVGDMVLCKDEGACYYGQVVRVLSEYVEVQLEGKEDLSLWPIEDVWLTG